MSGFSGFQTGSPPIAYSCFCMSQWRLCGLFGCYPWHWYFTLVDYDMLQNQQNQRLLNLVFSLLPFNFLRYFAYFQAQAILEESDAIKRWRTRKLYLRKSPDIFYLLPSPPKKSPDAFQCRKLIQFRVTYDAVLIHLHPSLRLMNTK